MIIFLDARADAHQRAAHFADESERPTRPAHMSFSTEAARALLLGHDGRYCERFRAYRHFAHTRHGARRWALVVVAPMGDDAFILARRESPSTRKFEPRHFMTSGCGCGAMPPADASELYYFMLTAARLTLGRRRCAGRRDNIDASAMTMVAAAELPRQFQFPDYYDTPLRLMPSCFWRASMIYRPMISCKRSYRHHGHRDASFPRQNHRQQPHARVSRRQVAWRSVIADTPTGAADNIFAADALAGRHIARECRREPPLRASRQEGCHKVG